MDTLTTIPVTVTEEAAAHVAELGMSAELQQMIDHARGIIAGLQRIEVSLQPPYDTGYEDAVIILALQDPATHTREDPSWEQFRHWKINTFSPDVYRHFTLLMGCGSNHAG